MALNRRDFLKMVGLIGTSAALGCGSEPAKRLIPYIIPPEDIIPGEATWYATTCRECPAGCGLLAKNRDGHIIKVEGNPLHPVNQGRLCARGQASLQGLYNPDRLKGPMRRSSEGKWEPLSWDEGERLLIDKLSQILKKGKGERVVFLTDLIKGSLGDLVALWLSVLGSGTHLQYEPYTYESLRKANQTVFGIDGIPTYHIDRADFLISFGADFLETWLSNVEYARRFASFRSSKDNGRPISIYVGPRLSLTAANADHWISVPPGTEYLVALGTLKVLLEDNFTPTLSSDKKSVIKAAVENWSFDVITAKTGVGEQMIRRIARKFAEAKRPLALSAGSTWSGSNATETAVTVNLLCTTIPGTQDLLDFESISSLRVAATGEEMKSLSDKMQHGEIELLMLSNVNPVFSLPVSLNFLQGMKSVPFIVSFSSTLDETSRMAHLSLPTHTPFESWGDYEPKRGVWGWMQPIMGPMFNTHHLGDLLISTGKQFMDPEMFPWQDFYHMMRDLWRRRGRRRGPGIPFESFWLGAMTKGGIWDSKEGGTSSLPLKLSQYSFPSPETVQKREDGLHFITYPTLQFFDGRGANRPWLQELPDPLTNITWGNWVEIHPETAKEKGLRRGELLSLQTPHGSIEAVAYLSPGVHPDALAMPIGQGHDAYGRFSNTQAPNPMSLLSPDVDTSSGGILWSVSGVDIKKLQGTRPIPNTDGSLFQHGRGIAQSIPYDHYKKARGERQRPVLRLPLPEGYDAKEDFYPPHPHLEYRWAMVVDLDRCIGCEACVVACHAENNVAVVGKELILKGREMSWLRIERFFEQEEPFVRFLPMLCQHCENAPCESVCPVFAPHHSVDGLNNQVYNRCIGTRYCSQNCPYKVRRFNWFTFTLPEPLHWQLNPDVTVRQKGVMEKCSFCVQRIVEAKRRAKNERRPVKDGEVIPACVQTCPTDALVFGNLKDPESRVSQLITDPRAYQVLGHLNTKPAVIYLKKIIQRLEGL